MILFVFYVKQSKLERFHQREVLYKNLTNYYRAMENIINFSKFKDLIISNLDGQISFKMKSNNQADTEIDFSLQED